MYFVKEDGECHKARYDDDYESDEEKHEMLQQTELINLVLDKDRVQEGSCLGKPKERTMSRGEESRNEVSLQCSYYVSKQRGVKTESSMHLVNVYSKIEEELQSLNIVVAADGHEDELLLRVVSQVEERMDTSLQHFVMLASIQRRVSKYVDAKRGLKGNLLFEREFADIIQELNIAEGDVYKNIKEERVEAISTTIFRATFEIGLLIADERMAEKSIKQSIA